MNLTLGSVVPLAMFFRWTGDSYSCWKGWSDIWKGWCTLIEMCDSSNMKNILHDALPWLPTSPQVVHKLEQAVFPGASHKVKSCSMEDKKLGHLTKPTARNLLAYSWSCEKAGAFLTKSEKGSHSYRLTTPSSHVFVQVGQANTISTESTSYHLLSMKSM